MEKLNQLINKHGHQLEEGGSRLVSCANTGFYSNCSHSFWSIVELINQGHVPDELSFKHGFRNYKDEERRDFYDALFKTDSTAVEALKQIVKRGERFRCPDHHGVYRLYPYQQLNKITMAYFSPADEIQHREEQLQSKYAIDFSNTLAVCYRGTDKATEVQLADPEEYIDHILENYPSDLRVWIQTDQEQVRQLFLDKLPNSFSIEEMPTTTGSQVLHHLNMNKLGTSKVEFAQNLLATTIMLSKCRVLVNHTGNMAAWICLFRGHADRTDQFDRYGNLVGSYELVRGILKNNYRKARRIIRRENSCYV